MLTLDCACLALLAVAGSEKALAYWINPFIATLMGAITAVGGGTVSGYAKLYMVPDGAHFASVADFKTPVRVETEQAGDTIVANMGDQPSDLQGGHADEKFLLPDPYYRVP